MKRKANEGEGQVSSTSSREVSRARTKRAHLEESRIDEIPIIDPRSVLHELSIPERSVSPSRDFLKEEGPFPDPDLVDRAVSRGRTRDGVEGVDLKERENEGKETGSAERREEEEEEEERRERGKRKKGRKGSARTRFKISIIPLDTPINDSTVSHSSETTDRGVLD